MKGIEYFTALISLQCGSNQLKELDLSNNTELWDLNCSGNQLTSLDVSNNTELRFLVCPNNKIKELDLSNNLELRNLYCPENRLKKLDVSGNAKLTSLICENNYILETELPLEPVDATIWTTLPQYAPNTIPVTVVFIAKIVNFNYDGWTFDIQDEYDSVEVENGSFVSVPTNLWQWGQPAHKCDWEYSCVHAGWYNGEYGEYGDDGHCYEYLEKLFDLGKTPITEDLVLTARWKIIGDPISDVKKSNNRYGIRFANNIVSDKAKISVVLSNDQKAVSANFVVYDMMGNVVFTAKANGNEPISWDLRNNSGRFVANGTYLVIAEVKDTKGMNHHYSGKLGVKR